MALSLRPMTIYPITVRELEVLRVTDVTPGMRRVTLGGPGLAAHTAPNGMPVNAFRSDGFDDEFKLFLTHPNRTEPLFPEQGDGHVIWPRDPELVSRTYTVRRWDAEVGELDVDFVVHGMGAATTWARRAQVGDVIPVAGPKSSAPHPQGVDWTLVAGDETALPAIARWLEEWPEGARGQVFVEIEHDAHRQDLAVPDGVELTWLSRHGAAPGTTTVMFDALRAAPWWDGEVFAWVAGEATTLVPIRRWLRGEKGLAKENVEVTGYWRRSELAASAEDPELPADLDDGGHTDPLHELTEIVPGLVLRAAATLDVPEALGDGPLTSGELAARLGLEPAGTALLLDYLAAIDIVERVGGDAGTPEAADGAGSVDASGRVSPPSLDRVDTRYRLTELGGELLDDYTAEQLDLRQDGAARELTGAFGLLAALTAGGSRAAAPGDGGSARPDSPEAGEASPGSALPVALRPDFSRLGQVDYLRMPNVVTSRLSAAEEFCTFFGPTLVAALPLADCGRVTVVGDAAGPLAALMTSAHPRLEAVVLAAPSELEVARSLVAEAERVTFMPGSLMSVPDAARADIVVLAGALPALADADARHALAEAARIGASVFVFEETVDPDDVDEHDLEQQLITYALHGGGERTEAQLRSLYAAAGLTERSRELVGWGGTLHRLTAGA